MLVYVVKIEMHFQFIGFYIFYSCTLFSSINVTLNGCDVIGSFYVTISWRIR